MEKGLSKELIEEGYETPVSGTSSELENQAVSKDASEKENISSPHDSSGSKPLSEINDKEVEADGGNNAREATGSENIEIEQEEEGKMGPLEFKGISLLSSGKWGAQLYYKAERKWLGTFKSGEEAAKAYDRAHMKIKGKDVQINFPSAPVSDAEKLFQDHLSLDEVMSLIRDHNYDRELQKWNNGHGERGENVMIASREPVKGMHHLFEKKVTVSDLGKLHRLVIPKQHSRAHFPVKKLDDNGETLLTFVDTSDNREWEFKFSYWKSSKSFVLTTGWLSFVKYKGLKEGDTVSFSRDTDMPSNIFYITVHDSQNLMCNNCLQDQTGSNELVQKKGNDASSSSLTVPILTICEPKKFMKSDEDVSVDQKINNLHGLAQLGKRKAVEDESENKSYDAVKLFGVVIGWKVRKLKDNGVEIDPKAKYHLKLKIHPKDEIKSKSNELSWVEIESEGNGQRNGKDIDTMLRL